MSDNELLKIAQKYLSISSLKLAEKTIFHEIIVRGLEPKAFCHMSKKSLQAVKAIQSLRDEAKKFNDYADFKVNSPKIFHACKNLGILGPLTSHMQKKRSPNGYWDEKNIMATLSCYLNYRDFYKNNFTAFRAASKLGILDQVKNYYLDKAS